MPTWFTATLTAHWSGRPGGGESRCPPPRLRGALVLSTVGVVARTNMKLARSWWSTRTSPAQSWDLVFSVRTMCGQRRGGSHEHRHLLAGEDDEKNCTIHRALVLATPIARRN